MKKWLKLNYKYYVVAFVAFVAVLVRVISECNWLTVGDIFTTDKLPLEAKLLMVVSDVSGINSQFLVEYPKIFVVGFIILHGVMLWGQRNKSEREFLETLPVKRERIVLYRFVMDVITTIVVVFISCMATYVYMCNYFSEYDMELPWLSGALVGYGVTLCCYVVLILGVIYFLESVMVRGDLKIITSAACILMFQQTTSWLYNAVMCGKDHIYNKFIGFIKMYAVGGKEYKIDYNSWENYGYWIEKDIPFDLYYQGQKYEFRTGINTVEGDRTRWGYTEGVVAFSELELYIGYALAYLVLGALMILLAVQLTKKQDLAKRSFYFNFAPVMVGLLIFVTVFMFFFVQIPEYWYSCLLFALIVFVLFMYLAGGRRKIKM